MGLPSGAMVRVNRVRALLIARFADDEVWRDQYRLRSMAFEVFYALLGWYDYGGFRWAMTTLEQDPAGDQAEELPQPWPLEG
jgi:hypothetical protein